MVEKFENGKRYIFSKKLFIEVEQDAYEACKDWVDKLDGQEVESCRRIDGCMVAPEWCEEIIPHMTQIVREVADKRYKTALQRALEQHPKMDAGKVVRYGCPYRYKVGVRPVWCDDSLKTVDQCQKCWNQKEGEKKVANKKVINKFKVGDIVRGTSKCIYVYTGKEMTKGIVREVTSPNGYAIVEILESTKGKIGFTFHVRLEHLELVPTQFTKKDLKTGMWVQQKNNDMSMVLFGTANGNIISGQGWTKLSSFKNDLTAFDISSKYDIVKVYQPESNRSYVKYDVVFSTTGMKLIWERPITVEPPKVKEISKDEVLKILKDKFGMDVKITE